MVDINIQENLYNLDLEDWFEMAKRINKKRSFLFVSKRLGKHLENNSHKVLYAGMLLARRLNEVFVKENDPFDWSLNEKDFTDKYILDYYKNNKKMVFIGFAETATGLGQCVFDRFDNSYYFHTTREEIDEKESILNFEEEHSHATSHRCYVDKQFIDNELPVILVDDEVTTGNTSLNIIKDIHSKYPRKDYVVVSILNWMNEDEVNKYKKFEKENNINIHFVYLVKGLIDRDYKEDLGKSDIIVHSYKESSFSKYENNSFNKYLGNYIKETGRFGLTSKEQNEWKKRILMDFKPSDKKILVIGNGELMYIPILISYALGDKKVKTTTRSPIFVEDKDGYLIRSGIRFKSVDGSDVYNYLYNLEEDYDESIFIIEGNNSEELINDFVKKLKSFLNIKHVKILNL